MTLIFNINIDIQSEYMLEKKCHLEDTESVKVSKYCVYVQTLTYRSFASRISQISILMPSISDIIFVNDIQFSQRYFFLISSLVIKVNNIKVG